MFRCRVHHLFTLNKKAILIRVLLKLGVMANRKKKAVDGCEP